MTRSVVYETYLLPAKKKNKQFEQNRCTQNHSNCSNFEKTQINLLSFFMTLIQWFSTFVMEWNPWA